MKYVKPFTQQGRLKSLYIPHGSDEIVIDGEICVWATIFISHMVQMKCESRDKKTGRDKSLYPTWFR
ncbi:hypothetical protein A45J_1844 [hot springs metagenome]|uniref:Uncharacterized protein n=1 Tax=hot springs metagenome TaxID=433727 RepID=A0A5J4L962_9ZZZZ